MSYPRIDAHHHLWRYEPEEFGWINDTMSSLRRDFLPAELEQVLRVADMHGAIAVQARQTVWETRFLLECAEASAAICGVVGWVPLDSLAINVVLDEFEGQRKLIGVREVAQGKASGFLERENFNYGIDLLTQKDLAYDVLILENQLAEAIRFIDRHPNQRFVIDHAAKPKIRAGEIEPWQGLIRQIARRQNVFCKVSGLATEAEWSTWSLEDIRPYLDTCVEAFSPKRLMAGSDWPVCLLATEYARWWSSLDDYFKSFSVDEQERIFGGTAMEFYRLPFCVAERKTAL